MDRYVPRTCRVVEELGSSSACEGDSLPLKRFRETAAYVLLGPPGSGKTESFRREAEATDAHYVTARDFLAFDDRPEWHDTTLFIDGLDEKRAGSADGRTSLDSIRNKLDRLGWPPFRLSCRDADWFGANDRNGLAQVSSSGRIETLRLQPLSAAGIEELLRCRPGENDAGRFVADARERGIGDLLAWPQSLNLLAQAVADGVWPNGRAETFEFACRTVLREHNEEHRIADPSPLDEAGLMDAAGKLCALQLLSGGAGYALPGGTAAQDFPALDLIPSDDPKVLLRVLGTKLFNCPMPGRAEPIHRQVAEYLAGKYLAGLIERGLPSERILALLAGHDGKPVAELRGLAAWLAVHSSIARTSLVERDPLGVLLYGDVAAFSVDEKLYILNCLDRDAQVVPWLVGSVRSDPRFGDLIDPKLGDHVRRILTETGRNDSRQSFVWMLMLVLKHGQALDDLTDLMMGVIRDGSWWDKTRWVALDIYLRSVSTGDERARRDLERLLEDIQSGSVPDPDDDLLGELLRQLYPPWMSASTVLQHLRPPRKEGYVGKYCLFWTRWIQEQSSPGDLAEILDNLVAEPERLRSAIAGATPGVRQIRKLPVHVLTRLLESSDAEFGVEQLFDWLQVASVSADFNPGPEIRGIKDWLDRHPEVQLELLALATNRCCGAENFPHCMHFVQQLLSGVERRAGFADWCLDQAIGARCQRASDYFIRKVAAQARNEGAGADGYREKTLRRLSEHPALKAKFDEYVEPFSRSWVEQSGIQEERSRYDRQQVQEQIRGARQSGIPEESSPRELERRILEHDRVEAHRQALLENRCPPAVLFRLAEAYLGLRTDLQGRTPRDRLVDLLGDDRRLIDAVLQGFRGCMRRPDLPEPTRIMEVGTQNRIHHLSLPLIAGAVEYLTGKAAPDNAISEEQMRRILAVHFTVPIQLVEDHGLQQWLHSHPALVADVLIESTRIKMRAGQEIAADIHELAHSADYTEVAKRAALPLLESFPLRCQERQLPGLSILLQAALRHCGQGAVRKTIERKLSRSSMTVSQRVYWLSAGLFLASPDYRARLERYVADNERRIRCLAETLRGWHGFGRDLDERLDVGALESLIGLMGTWFRPHSFQTDSGTGELVTLAIDAADRVSAFIDRLAHDASREAAEALAALRTDSRLQAWQSRLRDAAGVQNLLRREAEYQHGSIEQVVATLNNAAPANAADLAAVTFDHLRAIASRTRHGSTSNWRHYWNVDSYNQAVEPRPEDACRDRLLSDLQESLESLGIDAQPEGHYANDKRSDIRVCAHGFNVPVEIKKSCHRDLWNAVRTQLIDQYARDPGADGYGIYLVFWFGSTESCRPTPGSGKPPKSADDLEHRLLSDLSDEEKRRIRVMAIDVSKPQ